MRKIIKYNPWLVKIARDLRNNMTLGEIIIWQEIKGRKLGVQFSRQIPIDQYIVDFYCKELLLAIEVDGPIHSNDPQIKKDFRRQERLEKLGVYVLRINDNDVKNNLAWVIGEIKIKIDELRPSPAPSQEGNNSSL